MDGVTAARAGIRLTAILVGLVVGGGVALAGTPPASNDLQDIPVFKDQLFGTWSGGDILTVGANRDQLPIDTTQTYGGLPSLRFDVVGPNNWWWASILAGQDWMPYSVEHYLRNGYLEFNVESTQVAISPDKQAISITITIKEQSSSKYRVQFIGKNGRMLNESTSNPAIYTFTGDERYVRATARVLEPYRGRATIEPAIRTSCLAASRASRATLTPR